jgi:hypothetical protein
MNEARPEASVMDEGALSDLTRAGEQLTSLELVCG